MSDLCEPKDFYPSDVADAFIRIRRAVQAPHYVPASEIADAIEKFIEAYTELAKRCNMLEQQLHNRVQPVELKR